MVAGADQGDAFERDMGYSVAEFFRILPNAVGDYDYSIDGDRIEIRPAAGSRRLELRVRELPERKIGMIRIPRIQLAFRFEQFTPEERREFLAAFDRSFQRGGG